MTARPLPRQGLMSIEAYAPGKSKAPPGVTVHKLSSNETPLGPSPKALAAAESAMGKLALYPDGGANALRDTIAHKFGLDPSRIVCGNGSDELLTMVTNAYMNPGDEGIYCTHGFLVYRIAILAAGGVPVIAPEQDLTADVDAILAAVTPRTKIVYLANPNNPTGTYLPFDEIKRLHAGLPPQVLLVLDAAYAEYVRRNDYAAGLELVMTSENVVMTRTFSKIHGLAALRLGWMVAPEHIVDIVNRIRPPFNVNAAALAAGAAAIADDGHVAQAVSHNDTWLEILTRDLTRLGLTVTPSVANFLLVHFPEMPGRTAREADEFLTARGLILRRMEGYGLPHALRLSIGTEEANRLVIAALEEFMRAEVAAHA